MEFLQKLVEYHIGNFVCQDEEGNLYKGIVNFMIVPLKQFIPVVIKSCPETTISGKWLKDEIDRSIFDLKSCGFKTRAVISDDHSSNVSAFNNLLKNNNGDKKLLFYHPLYQGSIETFNQKY